MTPEMAAGVDVANRTVSVVAPEDRHRYFLARNCDS
jgi:hypothetical protein